MAILDRVDRRSELGEFLRSRRARISPGETGVASYGTRPRRVPGLRREELAQLAGVSVDYYVRLEQGRTTNVSDAVLDAVARGLRLDDQEREHLSRLARPARAPRHPSAQQVVHPHTRILLDAMTDAAAYIIGRRTDVLAWNHLGAALIDGLHRLPTRRNFAWLLMTDEPTQALFLDLPAKARDLVAFLRVDAGRHPDDPRLAELIGELSLHSELFRRHWAEHPVGDKSHALTPVRHPIVGRLELAYVALRLPDDPDQVLVTYSAVAGSESAAALRVLASWYECPTPSRPAP
jgi:transcriptional regulator with XRE-family HTH domain